MGAPTGNNNRGKNKPWQESLKRALARKSGSVSKGLDAIADQVVDLANKGDWSAIVEIGNRLEGKPAQTQILAGDEDNPLKIEGIAVKFTDA